MLRLKFFPIVERNIPIAFGSISALRAGAAEGDCFNRG